MFFHMRKSVLREVKCFAQNHRMLMQVRSLGSAGHPSSSP